MFKKTLLISVLLITPTTYAYNFKGYIGKYPVTVSIEDSFDSGIYMYEKHRTPIILTQTSHKESNANNLFFDEQDNNQKSLSRWQLTKNATGWNGTWQNLSTQATLPISLTTDTQSVGLLQANHTKDSFVRMNCDDTQKTLYFYNKQTGSQINKLITEGNCTGIYDLNLGDFNFDGFDDVSVFDQSFAGANTTSLYFLYNHQTSKFEYEPQLNDVNLEFDNKKKIILSHNSCCAGSKHLNQYYQWQGKKLVLFKKQCFVYNDKSEDYILSKHGCD